MEDNSLLPRMYDKRPTVVYPRLEGNLERARASMLGHLGDYQAARTDRLARLRRQRSSVSAARELIEASVTHGTLPGRMLLLGAKMLPPVGRPEAARDRAERKRLT